MRAMIISILVATFAPAAQAAPAISVKLAVNAPVPAPSGKLALRLTGHVGDRIGASRFGWQVGVGINTPVAAVTRVSPRLETNLSMKLYSFDSGVSLGAAAGWIGQFNPDCGKGRSFATGPGVGPSIGVGSFKAGLTGTFGWTVAAKTVTGFSVAPWVNWTF